MVSTVSSPVACRAFFALFMVLGAGCSTLPSRPDVPHDTIELAQQRQGDPVRHDSPEIAKSRGDKGGYVVLWPRVVPKSDDPQTQEIASLLQARLTAMANRAAPGAPVDVRPSPERACPREGGCVATSLGAVLSRKGNACAAAVTIGSPGTSPVRVFGWAGTVEVKAESSAFRDPPENLLVVKEWAKCDALLASLKTNTPPSDESPIEKVVKDVGTSSK